MTTVIGNGIYGMTEAARLLGTSRARISAWYRGWPHGDSALLRSDYEDLGAHGHVISFLDLMDAAASVTLREKHGVSPKTIRKLRGILREKWNTPHPFARQEFYTDESGRQVFCELASEDGEVRLLEVLRHQYAIPQVLLPFLKRVEYNKETRLAQVLSLMGRVVLDPRRKYGKPTVQGTGMATAILHDCFIATRSEDVVAEWYSVSPDDVREAVAFETEFRGIAA